MSLRLRLLVLLLAIYSAGGILLTRWVLNQVRPRYLESMEESLVDTSVLLAGVLETQLTADPVDGIPPELEYQTHVELESLRRASAGQEELRFYYPYLERLRHEAELSDQSIVRLEKELHEQKSAVLTASRNKKVIEILRSRKKSEFLAEVDRQEQKAIVVVERARAEEPQEGRRQWHELGPCRARI